MPKTLDAVIAGHICLDIIPSIPQLDGFVPGKLVETGAAVLSTGGAVSNTGRALHTLGASVRLVGRVGDDLFGQCVQQLLGPLGEDMTVVAGEKTSYTVVLNLDGQDRMFLHCPGGNDAFSSDDIPEELLLNGRHFHFGYPPLMARMFENEGAELVKVFQKAKAAGCTTSLDMSLPDPDSASGRAPWATILANVLPFVDIFAPSLDELAFMLPGSFDLAESVLAMGAKSVAIKNGDRGMWLTVAEQIGGWEPGSIHQGVLPVEVRGTTGAGDATIAGLLYGFLRGFDVIQSAKTAAAAGATCCEAVDSVSGVRPFSELSERFSI